MRSTNFVKATYTEIIDLQTVNGKCSIIGIHTPTGAGPYNKLRGYFTQYRKYKYGGIDSMVMCPAANLPVDPLGLTGVVGTTDLMDPRDALNPIMFHGCHGESMSDVLNTLFSKHQTNSVVDRLMNPTVGFESQSADKLDLPFEQQVSPIVSQTGAEDSYYRFLTDPKWRKFGIQSMVKLRKLRPLTWRVASTMPYLPNSGDLSTGVVGSPTANAPVDATAVTGPVGIIPNAPDYDATNNVYVANRVQMQQFTNGVTPLGWLPTTVLTNQKIGTSQVYNTHADIVRLPKLFMGCLVLPPSYNVEQFFRLSIRHNFYFKEFTQSLSPLYDIASRSTSDMEWSENPSANSYFNWIDYTDNGSKVIIGQSEVDKGTTLDIVDGKSSVVSDSAM